MSLGKLFCIGNMVTGRIMYVLEPGLHRPRLPLLYRSGLWLLDGWRNYEARDCASSIVYRQLPYATAHSISKVTHHPN